MTAQDGQFLEVSTGDASIALRGRVQPLGNASLVREDLVVRARGELDLTIRSACVWPNDGVARGMSPAPSAWRSPAVSSRPAGADNAILATHEQD